MCQCLCQQESHNMSLHGEDNCLLLDCTTDIVELGINSRCKRKEHDDSEAQGCKHTKPSSPATTSVDMYIKSWMKDEPKRDEGRFTTVRVEEGSSRSQDQTYGYVHGHEKRFSNDRREKKDRKSSKVKQIAKKIAKLQEVIDEVEKELEEKAGHPLSKADKKKDEQLGNLILEQKKMKKAQKELREKEGKERPRSFEGVRIKVENNMDKLRNMANRPSRLEDMTQAELEAEKTDLMEELDDVVEELGGLSRKEDRQEMAGLYQRLRNLKRITRKPSFSSRILLDEIPEHSSIEVISQEMPRRCSVDSIGEELEEEEEEEVDAKEEEEEEEEEEEWHVMTETELQAAVRAMREQKRTLKKMLKEFEQGVQARTGRKVGREDRQPVRAIYRSYKKTKAKIKLVDALLVKFNVTGF